MRTVQLLLVVLAAAAVAGHIFRTPPLKPARHPPSSAGSAGPAVTISDYQDNPKLARMKTLVEHLPGLDTEMPLPKSYAGFVTVNETEGSNMFFWFFEAKSGNQDAPILLWLQGGPGSSSLFGLFVENGPYGLTDNLTLYERNITWNQEFAMLYIDNPVGTGFSYTNSQAGVSTDMVMVADNLYSALTQILHVYDEDSSRDFYVTGESYGGKYVPSIVYKIMKENANSPSYPINLIGWATGDGLSDPFSQCQGYAQLAYQFGIASYQEYEVMLSMQQEMITAINAGNWSGASDVFVNLVDGPPDYFQTISGSPNYYDVRISYSPNYGGDIASYVNSTAVRAALNVGDHYYQNGDIAANGLQNDLCKSVKPYMAPIMDKYKSLIYNGQFDFIVGAPLTMTMLQNISWSTAAQWKQAPKIVWRLYPNDSDVAGYVQTYGNFTQIVVRDAGHILPFDQPAAAYDMITRFVNNIAFDLF